MGLAAWQSKVVSRIEHCGNGNCPRGKSSISRVYYSQRVTRLLLSRGTAYRCVSLGGGWDERVKEAILFESRRRTCIVSRFHEGGTKAAAAGSFEILPLAKGEVSPRGFSHTILPELTAPSAWKGIIYWKGAKLRMLILNETRRVS